jgi:metalloendopeptidase OMA1, mitochondrial
LVFGVAFRASQFFATLGLLLSWGCASSVDYVTGRPTINRFEIDEDVDLGTRHATLLLASSEAQGYTIDPDDIYTRTVRTVASRILAVPENRARMPPFPWEVRVVGFGEPNAWCFAGGQILVLAGLLEKGIVRDEDELAAILGHEMAHAAARHATERMTVDRIRSLMRWASPFGTFFGSRLIALGTNTRPADIIDALSKSEEGYGQSQELEADVIGLEFMARAGYNPQSALNIWRRLANRKTDLKNSGVGKSHPAYKMRLSELDKHLPVARWLADQRTTLVPDWLAKTGWKYVPPVLSATTTQTNLPSEGALPTGAKVVSVYQRNVDDVLAVHARLHTSELGEAPRIEIAVHSSRDLVESHLPFTAVLIVERLHATSRTEIDRSYLARQAVLGRAKTTMRVAISRYPPGRYRLRVRVLVGALLAETALRYDVIDM